MAFPAQHRTKLHSTNRADVGGISPSEQSILRLIGAVLLQANDEWQLQHRCMQLEAMAELLPTTIDIDADITPPARIQIPPQPASSVTTSATPISTMLTDVTGRGSRVR